MNTIQEKLHTRTAIKDNYLSIGPEGDVYMSRHDTDNCGFSFPLYKITEHLQKGNFENIVNVHVLGDSHNSGPNIKPSRKGIKRLLRIIKQTSYKIIQQNGQNFTIVGAN